MGWTTPKTWTGSEVLTSGDMNTYVGSNTKDLYDNKPIANQWMNQGTSVAQLNQRIESGYRWTVQANTANGSAAVLFNAAFGSAPRVVCSALAANRSAVAASVGTGGFTLYTYVSSGGTYTGTIEANWIAIGA